MLDRPLDPLTTRELEVLQLIADGLSDQEIGEHVFLSTGTVKWHIKNIYSKLGVHKRTAAVAQARAFGLLGRKSEAPGTPLALPNHNLPTQATTLVGREIDTHNAVALLRSEDCRLLALLGLGGIGKTRLAIHCGSQLIDSFADGVWFIPVDTVPSGFLPSAVAAVLPSFAVGQQDVREQLLRYLRHKQLLLILDSFEHLLSEVDYVVQILDRAPAIKILVTTREALNLSQEWVYRVNGLNVPTDVSEADPQSYGAISLFLQRSKQINSAQSPDKDMENIVRICHHVGGMPLAIELVTPWLRLLSPADVVHELERNRDLLSSSYHDVPSRHRSIKDVLLQSWSRLSADEQSVLAGATVLRGGGSRDAIQVITRASLPVLMSLVNKALLSVSLEQRYDMHPLVRQFADDFLHKDRSFAFAVRTRHSRYYATTPWNTTSASLGNDGENIWAAFTFALETKDTDVIATFTRRLWQYFEEYGWYIVEASVLDLYVHGIELFQARVTQDSPKGERSALLLLYESMASLMHTKRQYEQSRKWLGIGLELIKSDDSMTRARLLRKVGTTYAAQRMHPELMLQTYHDAETALGAELPIDSGPWWSEMIKLRMERGWAYYLGNKVIALDAEISMLENIMSNEGSPIQRSRLYHLRNVRDLRQYGYRDLPNSTLQDARSALYWAQHGHDKREVAWVTFTLGFVHLWRSEFDDAESFLLKAAALAQRVGDTMGTYVTAMAYLPWLYRHHQQVEEVEAWAVRGLNAANEASAPVYIGVAQAHLGWVAYRRGDLRTARRECEHAFEQWAHINFPFAMFSFSHAVLLAICLSEENLEHALHHAEQMMAPYQQLPPEPLTEFLEAALSAAKTQDTEKCRSNLKQYCEQARSYGYT